MSRRANHTARSSSRSERRPDAWPMNSPRPIVVPSTTRNADPIRSDRGDDYDDRAADHHGDRHRPVRRRQRHQPLLRDPRHRPAADPAARRARLGRDVRADPARARRRTTRSSLLDLQGHGRTADIDRPIDVRLMADDIAALIDHLGLDRPDVVGYSLGGGVAFCTAVEVPGEGRQAGRGLGEHPARRDLRRRCSPSRAR